MTNLFLGNALIGPDKDIAMKLADAMKVQESSLENDDDDKDTINPFVEAMEAAVVAALEAVLKQGANIHSADESGRELLVFAARLCNRQDLAEKFKTLSTLKVQPSKNYEVRDPLIEFMLGAKGEEQRFLIGPAATRAMADHAGFHCYFGAQELAILAHKEMKRRQAIDYRIKTLKEKEGDEVARRTAAALRTRERARRRGITDLAAEVQKIISHTVWHVGLPASSWNQGLNRAFILRFASIGYFTSEYVRTSMEDFIGHVHEFVNATFELTADTKDNMSGQRLARSAVKEAIAECYKFLKFDEFGPTVFDLDSLYAYWSDHGNMQTRSVAGEIYRELVSLRQQTIAHYMICAEAIGWMRYSGKYNPSHEDISAAYRLKELAWNNFNIYNFYDSERYMSRAADKLRGCMEADFQEPPRKKEGVQKS